MRKQVFGEVPKEFLKKSKGGAQSKTKMKK
jgi:hypothetical protein